MGLAKNLLAISNQHKSQLLTGKLLGLPHPHYMIRRGFNKMLRLSRSGFYKLSIYFHGIVQVRNALDAGLVIIDSL